MFLIALTGLARLLDAPALNTTSHGAGRGIGLAFARSLAEAGHRVVLTDIDGGAAGRATAEIEHDAVGLDQDVRDIASDRRITEEAAALGKLSFWVNNAGVLFAGEAWNHPDVEIATILAVNLRGVMAGSAIAIAQMRKGRGAVLDVASISALAPVPGPALYTATKAAVLTYTTSLQGDFDHARLPIRPDVVGTQVVTSRTKDPVPQCCSPGRSHWMRMPSRAREWR